MRHSENYKHPKTAYSGIIQYLAKKRLWSHKSTKFYDSKRELNRLILGFFIHTNMDRKGIMRSKKMIAVDPASKIIRSRFDDFIKYCNTLPNPPKQ